MRVTTKNQPLNNHFSSCDVQNATTEKAVFFMSHEKLFTPVTLRAFTLNLRHKGILLHIRNFKSNLKLLFGLLPFRKYKL